MDSGIDLSMRPLIQRLNRAGYKTLFCCSGLRAEHKEREAREGNQYLGYITFSELDGNKSLRIKRCALSAGLYTEPSWVVGPQNIRVLNVRTHDMGSISGRSLDLETDEEIRLAWKQFLNCLTK